MKWSELTNNQRNELIASTFFGWVPVRCDGDKAYVSTSDFNETMCHKCYAMCDDCESEDELVHRIIPVQNDYVGSEQQALRVAQKAQSMLAQASLQITLKPHGVHPVEVALWWAMSSEKEGYTFSVTRTVVEDCTLEQLAETICYVVTQAVGAVELDETSE